MAKHAIAHAHAGTIEQEPDVLKVPAKNYYDPQRFKTEVKKIFRRMPLVLAPAAEIPNPGDYKAMQAAGMEQIRQEIGPVLETILDEQGIDLILSATAESVVLTSERIDITQTVLDRLRADAPSN